VPVKYETTLFLIDACVRVVTDGKIRRSFRRLGRVTVVTKKDRQGGPDLDGLAHFIRERRTHLGLTQAQLGERLLWEQVRVSNLERARYGLPSLPLLARLADSLEVRLTAVLEALGYKDVISPSVDEAQRTSSDCAALLYCLERFLSIPVADIRAAIDRAANSAAEAMGADAILAYLPEVGGQGLKLAAASPENVWRLVHDLRLERIGADSDWPVMRVYESGQPYMTGHAEQDDTVVPAMVEKTNVRSLLIVPILSAGTKAGVLVAASDHVDRFSDHDRAFFLAVAHWMGLIAARSAPGAA